MPIICGTDLTEHAAEAATAAALLATRQRETLRLIHVAEPELLGEPLEPVREAIEREAERLRALGAEVTTGIHPGFADEELVAQATVCGATLIVVGALGRRGGDRWFIGSVADRVAQASPVPLLVVRSAAPFLGWARGERALRLVVGADFSSSADAALAWVKRVRPLGGLEVEVAHIYWPPHEHARLGIGGPMSLVDRHPEVERILTRELADRLGGEREGAAPAITIEMNFGRAADALVALAERHGADVLVVGTHQREGLRKLWYGSVSCDVLHAAPMAVACVPAAAGAEPRAAELPEVRSVLAATDLSPLGNQALPLAYALAGARGTVHLLSVVELGVDPMHAAAPAASTPAPRVPAAAAATLGEDVREQLRGLIPAAAAARGIATELHVVAARSIPTAINQAAERLGASLIVLASRGRSGLAKAVLGSVAQAVLAESARPVVIVRSRSS